MVKISTLDVVVSRNSENLNAFRFIHIDLLCKRCSLLYNVHFITIDLESNRKQMNPTLKLIISYLFRWC